MKKRRVICLICGYAEFSTVLRDLNSREIFLSDWDPLTCPRGCASTSGQPIVEYANGDSLVHCAANERHCRRLLKQILQKNLHQELNKNEGSAHIASAMSRMDITSDEDL